MKLTFAILSLFILFMSGCVNVKRGNTDVPSHSVTTVQKTGVLPTTTTVKRTTVY